MERHRAHAGDRSDVDDGAAAAREHVAAEGDAGDIGTALIDADHVIVRGHAQFGRPDRHLNDAGAVDQHFDRPNLRFDRRGTSFGRLFVGHVGATRVTADLLRHCLGARKLAIKHHDFGAGG